ncbi:hypothetical protein GC207_01105 [bacterium]|nr:hypothetical protein [bacterium]
MTRVGKIARLSRDVRNELNRRLQNGQPAKKLVGWLNELTEVKTVLKAYFGSRPISEQNVSQWKAGGYVDWLRHQESLELAQTLVEEADELESKSDDGSLADRLAAPVSLALARLLRELTTDPDLPACEKADRILPLATELAQVRRHDHERERLRLLRERWESELEENLRKDRSNQVLAPIYGLLASRMIGDLYRNEANGNAPLPPEVAAFLESVPTGDLTAAGNGSAGADSKPVKPNQTGSKSGDGGRRTRT